MKALARRLQRVAADETLTSELATPVERAPRVARLHGKMKLGLQLRGAAERGELELH